MKTALLTLFMLILASELDAQTITGTVRGRVIDMDTRVGLPGANVIIVNSEPLVGTTTDQDGNFILTKVPVGRMSFQVSYMGYKPVIQPEILVSSGKETMFTVELEEEVYQAKEFEVTATIDKDRPTPASFPTFIM